MSLKEKIKSWKEYPNALGSESDAAIIVGEVAAAIGEDIPENIKKALKILSLRGTMRDIASAIQKKEELLPHPGTPSFHDVVDTAAAACGISWAEALAEISRYINQRINQID